MPNYVKNKLKKLSWTPVRKGYLYCSPACGAGCTHAAFLKATKAARNLAKALGRGWRPDVWENLGWHYKVTFSHNGGGPRIEVHPPLTHLGKEDSFMGQIDGSKFEHGKTPAEVLAKLQRAFADQARVVIAQRTLVEEALDRLP